jgi:hypothetical protein
LLYATLAVLQKATTALPVLFVLSLVYFFREVSGKISFSDCSGKENAVDGCAFYYSYFNWLCMGFYTDSVKVLNPLAVEIDFGSIGKMELGYIRTALFRCAVGDSVLEAYICY